MKRQIVIGVLSSILMYAQAGTERDTVITKDHHKMLNEVVVTGVTGDARQKDSPIPVNMLTQRELQSILSTNIIDAIAHQPGVSQITTGCGISKPVIRGLGYNRIVTINDGLRQEGQQWGDEHGIEIDGMSVGRVEVLKGPASLLYGSDAMAGVVIFHPESIMPLESMKATITGEYQTNNGLVGGSVNFAGNQNGWVWNWRYSDKGAHAYKNKYDGYVPNTQFHERAVSGLLGVVRKWGHSHLKLSYYNTTPSICEGERDPQTGQLIFEGNDLKSYKHGIPYQEVYHYKAVSDNMFYIGENVLKATIGYQQNRRKEYEAPEECGLDFKLHTVNYDIHYQTVAKKNWKLVTGINGMYQQSENLGDEYLIPAYNLFDFGAFITSSIELGKWNISGGLRIDNRHLHSLAQEGRFMDFKRNFTGVTGSVGAVYHILPDMHVRLNLSRGFRTPNLSELASNGEHEGTIRYEIGNNQLKPEHSWQIDAGWDYTNNILSAQLSLFVNLIDNYIFAARQDDRMIDDLPVYLFTQGNATLWGGEANLDVHPIEKVHFMNTFSFVRATLHGQPADRRDLPMIPAPRWTSEIRYDIFRDGQTFQNTFIKLGMECNFKQNHYYAADNTETPTPAYTLWSLSAGTDICRHGKKILSLFLTAENLTNKAYQSHLSRLKYADINIVTGRRGVFNMGRNIGCKIIVPINL